jgi:hypothetical protein
MAKRLRLPALEVHRRLEREGDQRYSERGQ